MGSSKQLRIQPRACGLVCVGLSVSTGTADSSVSVLTSPDVLELSSISASASILLSGSVTSASFLGLVMGAEVSARCPESHASVVSVLVPVLDVPSDLRLQPRRMVPLPLDVFVVDPDFFPMSTLLRGRCKGPGSD